MIKKHYYEDNKQIHFISYYNQFNELDREDGPAGIGYDRDGKLSIEEYYKNGKLHRENGKPAIIEYFKNGELSVEKYYLNGINCVEGCPSYVAYKYNGNIGCIKYHNKNEELHRDGNKPAFLQYYDNKQIMFESYYKNNKHHRLDGPSIIVYNSDGIITNKKYFIDGIEYNEFQYMVAIASLKGE